MLSERMEQRWRLKESFAERNTEFIRNTERGYEKEGKRRWEKDKDVSDMIASGEAVR